MFKSLYLENFKGFDYINIPFNRVTLLAGLNSAGKSSALHALLLLKQIDWERSPRTSRVEMFPNGPFVSLGSGRELLHEFAKSDHVSIKCEMVDGVEHEWKFVYNNQNHKLVTENEFDRDSLERINGISISYLNAERWGPRVTYPYENNEEAESLGVYGQYAIRYLIDHGEDPVANLKARHPDAKGASLTHNVQAWLGEISPGVRMDFTSLGDTGFATAGFGFGSKGEVSSRYYRPTHVGFGLSYSLPLLVLMLSAKEGDIILLENPEAHIHPRGQAQLARLIALTGSHAQVIVETHSDHIMNGLRVSVKNGDLIPEDLAFNYFRRDGRVSEVQTPQIDENGKLSFWPEGFFDEHELLLAALVRRPKKID
jgi:predicted ATPase